MTNGAAIVERSGGRATFYVAMALMGTVNQLGEQFRAEDLHPLVDRGHEVASHTCNHLSAHNTPSEEFEQDAILGEEALRSRLDLGPSANFAYPYGAVSLGAKRRLRSRMRSCRATWGGFNGPTVDVNLLRANPLYGGIEQAEAAMQLVRENSTRRGWLIFYTHDVVDRPSPFGCTPALLERVSAFVTNLGTRILTVAEALDEIGVPGGRTARTDSPILAGSNIDARL
jgi:peptidoglycan/xylan/chitin deacetylase (PgdA/CDA1 family)